MAQIPATQGAPQASNIAVQDALPLIGTPSRENGQSVLNSIDSTLAKLFEDRNVLLAEGGTLSWNTTSNNLTFSDSLELHINSQVAGGSPTVIDLTSTTRAFSADGRMLYAVVDRSLGTAVITADSATLPAVVAANQEVFLLAKRVGSDLYFRNGFKLVNKQSATLSGDHNESVANDTTSGSAVTLAAVNTGIVRVTNGSLVSIAGIPAGRTGQQLIVINATGTAITFLEDNTGASANDRLYLGLNGAVTVLNQSAVIFTYDSTSNRWYAAGGTGSGSGSGFKNLLTEINSKFAGGVADWVTYDDGAVSSPVDGTGGSPSAITIAGTSSGSEVLEGLQSLKISKSAADGQGEGTSVLTKTIDRADRGKPFFVYFSYDATHTNFVRGDLKAYAYDVTNSQLLDVVNDTNNGELLQQKGQFSGVIFPQDTCEQVRLILHCTSTNASAYDVFVDEVVITPQASIISPVITDWTDGGTNTITATTTNPTKGTTAVDKIWYRRIGDSLEVRIEYRQTGAGTAGSGDYLFTIPNGYSIDSNKIHFYSTVEGAGAFLNNNVVGSCTIGDNTNSGVGAVSVYNATSVRLFNVDGPSVSLLGVIGSGHFGLSATNQHYAASFMVPISTWTQGASLTTNNAGLQTTKAAANKSAGSVTANTTISSWTNEIVDNYQGFDTSTGIFTAPRSGQYYVNFNVATTTGTPIPSIRVNGTILATGPGTSGSKGFVNAMLTLIKGDLVTVTIDSSLTLTTSTVDTRINITSIPDFNVFGVQGPIVVGAMTDWTDGGVNVITATTTSPTKGTTAVDKVWYRRLGDSLHVRIEYRQTAAGTTGTGDYLFEVPNGYNINLTKLNAYSTVEGTGGFVTNNTVGSALLEDNGATSGASGSVFVHDASHIRIGAVDATSAGVLSSGFYPLNTTNKSITAEYTVPISGWSSETRLYPTQRVIGTTYLKDVKSSGTAGGTATSGSYQTRTLNTQEGDTGFCSLSSNQFTLQPGTYEIEAYAPAYGSNNADTGGHKIKIRNITDSTDSIIGSQITPDSTTNTSTSSFSLLKGRLTITSSKVFELQHRVTVTKATDGFGAAVTFGDSEIYSTVKIDKIY